MEKEEKVSQKSQYKILCMLTYSFIWSLHMCCMSGLSTRFCVCSLIDGLTLGNSLISESQYKILYMLTYRGMVVQMPDGHSGLSTRFCVCSLIAKYYANATWTDSLSTRFCVCSLIVLSGKQRTAQRRLSTRFCVCSLIECREIRGWRSGIVSVQDFVYAHL